MAVDLLLCVATEFEGALLRERLDGSHPDVAIVRTGVGPVNAAHAVTLFLAQADARAIVVCGVGGAYPSSGLQVGDVVCAASECYGDLGATSPSGFLDMKALGFPVVEAPTPLFNEIPMQVFPVERRVPFVTVSSCTGTDGVARELETRTARRRRKHGRRGHRSRRASARRAGRRSARHQQPRDESRHEHLAIERGRGRGPGSCPLVDRAPLNFAFSSCPNDTFAFHALVHGLVPGPRVVPHLDDVEALNARAERGEAEVTKISIAAYARIRDRYALLRAGGAAGFGVGPIVVARQRTVSRRTRRHPGRAHDGSAAVAAARPLRDGADALRSDRAGGAAWRRRLRRADSRGTIHVPGEGTDAAAKISALCGKRA